MPILYLAIYLEGVKLFLKEMGMLLYTGHKEPGKVLCFQF